MKKAKANRQNLVARLRARWRDWLDTPVPRSPLIPPLRGYPTQCPG